MNIIPRKSRETGIDLFEDLEDFQKEMNRLFDLGLHRPGKKGNGGAIWAPVVDVVEEKDHLLIKAELPGMKKDEIEVTVDNDTLSIKGEKKEEKEIKEKDYIRSERYYGAFHRSFSLPTTVDSARVVANYKDGVLEVSLPKKEGAKTKEIKVEIK